MELVMTVIAFRPRHTRTSSALGEAGGTAVTGTFRSPRGLTGIMTGCLRLQRLVLAPRGVFVTGVFTGELREPDGTLVGRDSSRATAPADLARDERGLHPVVRSLQLELMGIAVEIEPFAIDPAHVFPAVGQEPAGMARARRTAAVHGARVERR
jgi:hypothetical protein